MQPRKPTKGPRPPQGPRERKPQHFGPYDPYWPYDPYYPWYDECYDDDWYYLSDRSSRPMTPKSRAVKPTQDIYMDPCQEYYQQGFKDGWAAAMDYAIYGQQASEPVPKPTPPEPTPMEGAEE